MHIGWYSRSSSTYWRSLRSFDTSSCVHRRARCAKSSRWRDLADIHGKRSHGSRQIIGYERDVGSSFTFCGSTGARGSSSASSWRSVQSVYDGDDVWRQPWGSSRASCRAIYGPERDVYGDDDVCNRGRRHARCDSNSLREAGLSEEISVAKVAPSRIATLELKFNH